MARAEPLPPTGVVVRKLVFTVVGVLLFAAGLTLMFEAMRAVMDVGGSCASGGPYEIRQECPDGAGLMVAGIFGGLVGTGLVVAGTFRAGPKLWTLAWPALFLSLGWNFLEYGIDPPPPEDGLVWGWLICAVMFLAMGGIPLLFLLWNARLTLWGTGESPRLAAAGAPAPAGPRPGSRSASAAASESGTPPGRPTVARFGSTTVTSTPDDDLVSDLERLATLHRSGQLTDDEFARAKDARLAEEEDT